MMNTSLAVLLFISSERSKVLKHVVSKLFAYNFRFYHITSQASVRKNRQYLRVRLEPQELNLNPVFVVVFLMWCQELTLIIFLNLFLHREKKQNKKTTVPVVRFSLVPRKLQHIGERANANFGEFRIDSVPNSVAQSSSKFDENVNTIHGAQTEASDQGSPCCDASLLTNVPPFLSTLKMFNII